MAHPPLSQSAKLYQERRIRGVQNTRRLPTPRFSPGANLIHVYPTRTPNPSVDAIVAGGGAPPDAGLTKAWPRGQEELS